MPPPESAPLLRQAVRLLAQLGGFLARKGNSEPGVETIWRSYTHLPQSIRALEYTPKLRRRGV